MPAIDGDAFGEAVKNLATSRKRIAGCAYSAEAKAKAKIEYTLLLRILAMLNNKQYQL